VDAVGLSMLSGAHMALLPRTVDLLRSRGLDDVLIVVGGIIPDEDVPQLTEIGVHAVFGPGSSTQDIVDFIRTHARLCAGEVPRSPRAVRGAFSRGDPAVDPAGSRA
jgi:methylmalonyl-CoA mutase cobalamin-binding domain/chain